MARAPKLAALAAALWLCACSLAREELEAQVIGSLRERIGAAGSDVTVDSLRLGSPKGSVFHGRVYLSSAGGREVDSIVVEAGLDGIRYEFPAPGPLVRRIFP